MKVAGRPVVVFLSFMVLTMGFTSAFAQLDSSQIAPLSVKAELPLYDEGDTVSFSGFIKNPDANNLIDVTVRVIGPLVNGTSSNIVQVKQIKPQLDGSFDGSFIVAGPLWIKKGDYKIVVNYGPQKAETTFFYNGGTGQAPPDTKPPPPQCAPGQIIVGGKCVDEEITKPPPQCGPGTVYDEATGTCIVAPPPQCPPGQVLVNGQCVDEEPEPEGPICGPGTHAEGNICVPDKPAPAPGGGCLIATAAFGSELAPQVQLLREVRDNVVFSTGSGTAFMTAFNDAYYSFSPTIADWERQNPAFKELVRMTLTPMLSTLSILNYVDIDSEQEMLGYGIGIILLNVGMYFVAPALAIVKLRSVISKRRL
ncbi:MAG TPA: CFI-box-CTERM domain-containing protein [Candidatus Nitrosotenuis sp.]|nr:CFI-box-CTERM domain-containing protein [Candidatus Nitrosotenuis sp.]